jgi:hypothetical protein
MYKKPRLGKSFELDEGNAAVCDDSDAGCVALRYGALFYVWGELIGNKTQLWLYLEEMLQLALVCKDTYELVHRHPLLGSIRFRHANAVLCMSSPFRGLILRYLPVYLRAQPIRDPKLFNYSLSCRLKVRCGLYSDVCVENLPSRYKLIAGTLLYQLTSYSSSALIDEIKEALLTLKQSSFASSWLLSALVYRSAILELQFPLLEAIAKITGKMYQLGRLLTTVCTHLSPTTFDAYASYFNIDVCNYPACYDKTMGKLLKLKNIVSLQERKSEEDRIYNFLNHLCAKGVPCNYQVCCLMLKRYELVRFRAWVQRAQLTANFFLE